MENVLYSLETNVAQKRTFTDINLDSISIALVNIFLNKNNVVANIDLMF